ncbi:uncharacterized protein N7458_003743 [Penicillium daleae]|uniref:Uncharacterized protein n=1 Tax=Penicillium daleae TaxID=63821 RepID=A0AAD6G5F1_9EURO|nr:uncharacterized protein N7458_003743 [Penicillium daleae]KAJ5456160.1 hypothetical protein N7458_003743 [Penicillium daleae]
MATHVMTHDPAPAPTGTAAPGNHRISVYGQPSPTNSSTPTPANNSPLPASHHRRPPSGPLYVPACSARTERPQKSSPITPPRSVHGSLDSLNEDTEPISHRSTMESKSSGISKVAEHEWMKTEHLGVVAGMPTRGHWKAVPPCFNGPVLAPFSRSPLQADAASSSCDSPTCHSSFGLFTCRHHCLHCGHCCTATTPPHLGLSIRMPASTPMEFSSGSLRSLLECLPTLGRDSRRSPEQDSEGSIDAKSDEATQPAEDLESSDTRAETALKANLGQTAGNSYQCSPYWNWSTF